MAQWLNGSIPRSARQKMVRKDHKLSVRRQCALQAVARSKLYYQPKGESAEKGGSSLNFKITVIGACDCLGRCLGR